MKIIFILNLDDLWFIRECKKFILDKNLIYLIHKYFNISKQIPSNLFKLLNTSEYNIHQSEVDI